MLKKNISLGSGVAIAISMVIGSGIFGLPGLVIESTNAYNAFIGWLVIIAMMPAMITIFCQLALRWPVAGGISAYATKGFGDWSSGGVALLTCATLAVGMPAFFFVGASYICDLIQIDSRSYLVPAAILLALLTSLVNVCGVKFLGYFNKVSVLFVVLIVLIITVNNFLYIPQVVKSESFSLDTSISIYPIWLASSIVFWAFQGWENMTFGLEEVKDPQRNIPKIFWYSFLIVSLLYFLFAAITSASTLMGNEVSGISGLTALLPDGVFGQILLCLMVIVLIANANAWVFGASRAWLSAAKSGVLPKVFFNINLKGIPSKGIWLLFLLYSLIICAIPLFKWDITWLFMATTQGFIILYGGALLAFIRYFPGVKNRIIAFLAFLSWCFLISGFGTMILYSLFFFAIGSLISLLKKG